MTRTFILVRHSKAEDRNNLKNDTDRPLTAEGIADTFKMADTLLNSGIKPDTILASTAERAIHTARIFMEVLNIPESDLIVTGKLYYSSAKTILDQVFGLPDTVNCVMCVAHNPGISDLARSISAGRVFFMGNTQMVIARYDIDQWHQMRGQKPGSFSSYKPDGK